MAYILLVFPIKDFFVEGVYDNENAKLFLLGNNEM